MKKLFSIILLIILCSIGTIWAEDVTISWSDFKALTGCGGMVSIAATGDATNNSSAIEVASNKSGTITITPTVPGYYIKSISFTDNNKKSTTSITCSQYSSETDTYTGTATGGDYVYTPGSARNLTSVSFSLSAGSSGKIQIKNFSVTLKTSSSAIIEKYDNFAYSSSTFSCDNSKGGSALSTFSTNVTSVSNSSFQMKSDRHFTISSETKKIGFISVRTYQDKVPNLSTPTGVGSYSSSTYTWLPGDGQYNSVQLTYSGDVNYYVKEVYVGLVDPVAVEPVFSLSKSTIGLDETAQIIVGENSDLDGISLSNITFGTLGIVTINPEGLITPVASGSTTIMFSSSAVEDKYTASSVTGENPLTITVKQSTSMMFSNPVSKVEIGSTVTNVATLSPTIVGAEVTYESSNTDVAIVDENTGVVTGVSAGYATITARYGGNETYAPSSAEYIIGVQVKVVSSKFWNGADWTDPYGGYVYGSLFIDDEIEIKGTEGTGVQISTGGEKTIDGNKVAARIRLGKQGTEDGNYLHFRVPTNTKITYWGIRSTSGKEQDALALSIGTFGANEQRYSMAAGDVECLVYYHTGAESTDVYAYSGNSAGVSMLAIKVEPIVGSLSHTLTVTSAGWASLYLNYPALVPSGATAYYASSISSSSVTLSPIAQGKVIPANTAIVVSAAAGNYDFEYDGDEEKLATITTNHFKGANMDITVSANSYYVLSNQSEPSTCYFGLYSGTTLGANKVFLYKADKPAAAVDRIRFIVEDISNATNIEEFEANDNVVKYIQNGQLLILRDGITYDALGRVVK